MSNDKYAEVLIEIWRRLKLLSGKHKLNLLWKCSLCVGKNHLFLRQHSPLFGAAFSAPLPGAVPASMMAAAPAPAGGAGSVAVAFLTGFGSSPSLPFPWGWARAVSTAISGPRSRNRESYTTHCSHPATLASVLWTICTLCVSTSVQRWVLCSVPSVTLQCLIHRQTENITKQH